MAGVSARGGGGEEQRGEEKESVNEGVRGGAGVNSQKVSLADTGREGRFKSYVLHTIIISFASRFVRAVQLVFFYFNPKETLTCTLNNLFFVCACFIRARFL